MHRPALSALAFSCLVMSLALIGGLHRNTYHWFLFVLSPLGDTAHDISLSFPHHLQYKLWISQNSVVAWTISDLLLASGVSIVAICYFQLLSQLSEESCKNRTTKPGS